MTARHLIGAASVAAILSLAVVGAISIAKEVIYVEQ